MPAALGFKPFFSEDTSKWLPFRMKFKRPPHRSARYFKEAVSACPRATQAYSLSEALCPT